MNLIANKFEIERLSLWIGEARESERGSLFGGYRRNPCVGSERESESSVMRWPKLPHGCFNMTRKDQDV